MVRRIAVAMLKGYKRFISPLLPPACRFHPTCSMYALGCFERFGFFKALWLSVRRLSKCHPLHPGGFDPVPPLTNADSSNADSTTEVTH